MSEPELDPPTDRWIPVAERLPESGLLVLLALRWTERDDPRPIVVTLGIWGGELAGWWSNDSTFLDARIQEPYAVTHWRPVPALP